MHRIESRLGIVRNLWLYKPLPAYYWSFFLKICECTIDIFKTVGTKILDHNILTETYIKLMSVEKASQNIKAKHYFWVYYLFTLPGIS